MILKRFFSKRILLSFASIVTTSFAFVSVSCSKSATEDRIIGFAALANDKKMLSEVRYLNLDVLFDHKTDFYKRLEQYVPYREAIKDKEGLGFIENGQVKSFDLSDLIKIKNAFIAYIKGLKVKYTMLDKEKKSLNETTDSQKIKDMSTQQQQINNDIDNFRNSLNSQLQRSVIVLIVAKQEALKNISAADFIKIHNAYTDQSISFVDYLSTKIKNIDKTKPLFDVYILRRLASTAFKGLYSLNYLFEIFPHFSITRAIKSKAQLEKDTEISRILNKNFPQGEKTNLDSNNNLYTKPFDKETTVLNNYGIFAYGDGLYISQIGDATFLGAAQFYAAGFKRV